MRFEPILEWLKVIYFTVKLRSLLFIYFFIFKGNYIKINIKNNNTNTNKTTVAIIYNNLVLIKRNGLNKKIQMEIQTKQKGNSLNIS